MKIGFSLASLLFSTSNFYNFVLTDSQVAPVVKNPPANAGDAGDTSSIPGLGRSLEKEMATHSSILAWRILWTEEPGWAYNPWAPKELDTTLTYARARQC